MNIIEFRDNEVIRAWHRHEDMLQSITFLQQFTEATFNIRVNVEGINGYILEFTSRGYTAEIILRNRTINEFLRAGQRIDWVMKNYIDMLNECHDRYLHDSFRQTTLPAHVHAYGDGYRNLFTVIGVHELVDQEVTIRRPRWIVPGNDIMPNPELSNETAPSPRRTFQEFVWPPEPESQNETFGVALNSGIGNDSQPYIHADYGGPGNVWVTQPPLGDVRQDVQDALRFVTGGRAAGRTAAMEQYLREQENRSMPTLSEAVSQPTVTWTRPRLAPDAPAPNQDWLQRPGISDRLRTMLTSARRNIRSNAARKDEALQHQMNAIKTRLPAREDVLYVQWDNRENGHFSACVVFKDRRTGRYQLLRFGRSSLEQLSSEYVYLLAQKGQELKKRGQYLVSQKDYVKVLKKLSRFFIQEAEQLVMQDYRAIDQSVVRPALQRGAGETLEQHMARVVATGNENLPRIPQEPLTRYNARRARAIRIERYWRDRVYETLKNQLKFKHLNDAAWRDCGFDLRYNDEELTVEITKWTTGMQILDRYRVPLEFGVRLKFKFRERTGSWEVESFGATCYNLPSPWHPHISGGGNGDWGDYCTGGYYQAYVDAVRADDPNAALSNLISSFNNYNPGDAYNTLEYMTWPMAWDIRENKWVTKDELDELYGPDRDEYEEDDY